MLKDVEKREALCTLGIVNWCNHYRKQCKFPPQLKTGLPYYSATLLLGIYPNIKYTNFKTYIYPMFTYLRFVIFAGWISKGTGIGLTHYKVLTFVVKHLSIILTKHIILGFSRRKSTYNVPLLYKIEYSSFPDKINFIGDCRYLKELKPHPRVWYFSVPKYKE